MGIENIKRWQWMIIGTLAGLLLAYLRISAVSSGSARSIEPAIFERYCLDRPEFTGNNPRVKSILVYPIEISGLQQRINRVECQILFPTADPDKWQYEPCVVYATAPFNPVAPITRYVSREGDNMYTVCKSQLGDMSKSSVDALLSANPWLEREIERAATQHTRLPNGGGAGINYNIPPKQTVDVTAWIKSVAADRNWISYHYAWWMDPKVAFWVYGAGGFLLIGVIWPSIQHQLVKAGLGNAPSDDSDYDLSRFGKGGKQKAAAAPEPVEEDLSRLDALEAQVLASMGPTEPKPVAEEAPTEIRKLDAAPLEAPDEEETEAAQAQRDFKGEYYPVARAVVKDEEK
jgi:hypothetical protein